MPVSVSRSNLPTSSGPAQLPGWGCDARGRAVLGTDGSWRCVSTVELLEQARQWLRFDWLDSRVVRLIASAEVLAQRVDLTLVRGADVLAVEHDGWFDHLLEGQLAHLLAVLDHERHVVRSYLERRPRAQETPLGVEPEPGIEEARVVGAELATRRVVRGHLGGVAGRNPHALVGQEQIEALGREDDPIAGLAEDRIPIGGRVERVDPNQVEHGRVVLRPVADLARVVAAEVEPQEQAVGRREIPTMHGIVAADEHRFACMELADVVVIEPPRPNRQPELVQREALPDLHGERQRHDLEVQLPAVAGLDLVETVTVVGDDPGEDVEATRGALRVRLAADRRRKAELLDERDEIGPVGLEDGSVAAEIQLVDDEALELHVDG